MSLRERLADAVLVVAHPDDEILWFSGVFPFVRRVLICYFETPGDESCSRARELLATRFPGAGDRIEFLKITESMVFGQANWADPTPSPYGLWLEGNAGRMPALPGCDPARYRTNHGILTEKLRERLAGVPLVVTHNPWGEYGHEDHVQVYRAVSGLRRESGFEVWFDTYASDRSAALMARSIARCQYLFETLPTQPEAVAPIEALYRETGCWTWPFADWRSFATETYALDPAVLSPHKQPGSQLPVNWLSVDFADWQTPQRSFVARLQRRIRRVIRPV